ncbi:hypothetical protein BsWGS_19962 [Bradybaena similaris]
MGANSSKTVKAKYEVKHTVEGQIVATNISHKGSIKKRNKNSIKIKEKKGLKKSKSVKGQLAHGANLSVIEESSLAVAEPILASCPAYRKKSSCVSCEARDTLLGKNRSRSGSEKSLRFSDFNKVLRKTRIYDWELEPINVPLHGVEEPRPDDICYICEVYTGSHVRACRVCYRAYHDSCLAKIGQPLTESSRQLLAADKWSCHQCVSLNHLLTQEEVKLVLNELENLNIAKDNLTETSYLKYCRHHLQAAGQTFTAHNEAQMVQQFRSVDQAKLGTISFTQFLNIETVRLLGQRCQESLVHLLTPAELAEARRMFHKLGSGVTATSAKSAVNGAPQVTPSWPVFLRDTALDLIRRRCNPLQTGRPDDTEDAFLTFSSCDSLGMDEDQYSTCNSDLEPLVEQPSPSASVLLDRRPETGTRFSQSSSRCTMLDDIQAHIDRSHRHDDLCGRPVESAASSGPRPVTDPQTTAEVTIQQTFSHPSSKCVSQAAVLKTGNLCADLKTSPERDRSSSYNDSQQELIPWADAEKASNRKEGHRGNTKPAHRKSEVIPRPAVTSSGQSRAVSQAGCKYKPEAACGILADGLNQWKC